MFVYYNRTDSKSIEVLEMQDGNLLIKAGFKPFPEGVAKA
jgi:hypothetical protein